MKNVDDTRPATGAEAREVTPSYRFYKAVDQRPGRRLTHQVPYHRVPDRDGRRLASDVDYFGYDYGVRDASDDIASEVEARAQLAIDNKVVTSGANQLLRENIKKRLNKRARARAATRASKSK